MATNKNQEITDYAGKIHDLKDELASLPFNIASGKIKNAHQSKNLRKQIARALTKIHQIGYQNAKTNSR